MSLNIAQDYLITTTAALIDGYSEELPQEAEGVVYRALPGSTVKSLANGRRYSRIPFVAVVRGGKNSTTAQTLLQSMVEALDLSSDSNVIQCNVTSEPSYAYIDNNENIHYTFNVDVLL